MQTRWSGGLTFHGTVRCNEPGGRGGCGSRTIGSPGGCIAGMSLAAAPSNCTGYFSLSGSSVGSGSYFLDSFDAGPSTPSQTSTVAGIFPVGSQPNQFLGGAVQPSYNPATQALAVVVVDYGGPAFSTAAARVRIVE